MLEAELRQAAHRDSVFLVCPGELQPEFPLCDCGRGVAARDKDAQSRITLGAELVHARLQRAELLPGPARQNPEILC